ncbi:UDP kinase [Candidatus Roizmanbacteria bacterium CG_4_10_14_0_2_um_filter_36_35]|uniref:UDP kinase n=3 Tax=Candidatus Roizmaniibacteriota TaxID=1752723 RepID=A0A2M7BVE7_9BACT|nr:diacylglycerol kinase family protein [Candidatus Roizmanbacteria bacterium]PIQ72973.1 MAG: UDP kinase [Candidatus Roizmanbacteria bacterium CG11_big_fil_rev_8_21_14_0_20_35_14]PIV10552.1 MAG: UDP kinase [Candidatus Roizmanbacteria bacterium CG03_land_8_20_14_0_80_35_26]PIZ67466.1 MAG: UDP kinase [Candidatus Roizmanbacteria bacterium CG_4_10_14_0_2_um_filter_36_35]
MLKQHTISVRHAVDGLVWALKTQPNYRTHLLLSIISIIASVVFKISYLEFLLIIFLITVGLVIETINTGFEQTTDAIDRKIREDIKIAKDVAAAAMLIYSIGATIIALIIFVPKFLGL